MVVMQTAMGINDVAIVYVKGSVQNSFLVCEQR